MKMKFSKSSNLEKTSLLTGTYNLIVKRNQRQKFDYLISILLFSFTFEKKRNFFWSDSCISFS